MEALQQQSVQVGAGPPENGCADRRKRCEMGLFLMAIPRIHSIFMSGLDFILLECKCQDQSCVMSLQEIQMVPLL